jgi:hypothetical protein
MRVFEPRWNQRISAAVVACFCSLPSAAQELEPPRIRVSVRMVLLPTRVSDAAGQPVFDLAPADFRILEDGKDQQLQFFALTSEPAHVALLMDTSGSTSQMLPQLRLAAEQFVERFHSEDRIALYGVDTDITRVCAFTGDLQALKSQISRMSPRDAARDSPRAVVLQSGGAGTLLYDAIAAVRREFPPEAKKRAILVFTDSWDIGSALSYEELAWQTMGGSEMLFAVVADLRTSASPHGPRQLSLLRVSPSGLNTNPEPGTTRWAVVLDLTAVAPERVSVFEAAAQDFLGQLSSLDRVWLFVERGRLLPLLPRAAPGAPSAQHPLPAGEAVHLLSMLRLAESSLPRVLLDQRSLRPDRVLILTDKKQAGLGDLAGFVTLAPASILEPEALGRAGLLQETAALLKDANVRQRNDQAALESVLALMEHRLGDLAAETGGDYFQIQHAAELQKIYQQIADQIRSSFLLGYYTTASPGLRKLEVRVPGHPVRVHSRRAVVVRQ